MYIIYNNNNNVNPRNLSLDLNSPPKIISVFSYEAVGEVG